MMSYTYLLINLLSVIVPLLFTFHSKVEFHKTWAAFFPSAIFSAIVFLIGDSLYTQMGVWGFNPKYLVGITIINLPLEELLFFFCIPYACMFSYQVFDRLVNLDGMRILDKYLSIPFILVSAIVSLYYYDRMYTFAAAGGLALLLVFVRFIYKAEWLGKFYFIYLVLMIPFMIVNGILTGTGLSEPVVWYNDAENMGLRMLTIPLEDVFYGMTLILLNVLGFEFLKSRLGIHVKKAV